MPYTGSKKNMPVLCPAPCWMSGGSPLLLHQSSIFQDFQDRSAWGGYLSITVKKISMTDISLCRGSYPQPLPPHPRPIASAKLIFLCNLLFSRSSCWRLSAPLKPLATRKGLNMPSRVCSSLTCHQIRNQMGITREGKISSKGDTVSLKAR